MIRNLITLLIWLLVQVPATALGIVVIPLLLLCGWTGHSTLWGNDRWGDGSTHPDHTSKTFFGRFNWLALRNPTSNLNSRYLSVTRKKYKLYGDAIVGDKKAGGFYRIKMGWAWEYYWIKPYNVFGSKRCIRVRTGWKIKDTAIGDKASFTFAINPVKPYLGV